MLEQETASIIAFILKNTNGLHPYYYEVPQSFRIPSVYFPEPELSSKALNLGAYRLEYILRIQFRDKDSPSVNKAATAAFTAILGKRRILPRINENGEPDGSFFMLKYPEVKILDTGVAQLTVKWDSPRTYEDSGVKMQTLKNTENLYQE